MSNVNWVITEEAVNEENNMAHLLQKLNSFTETALAKDKGSKKKTVVNPVSTRGSKKNEREKEDEEEEDA